MSVTSKVNYDLFNFTVTSRCTLKLLEKIYHLLTTVSYTIYQIQYYKKRAGIIQGRATGWTVQGSKPDGGGTIHTHPDWPWGALSLLYNGYQVSFKGSKITRASC